MNELKSHAVRIFNNTLESITGAESVERAKDTCHLARGYITGLQLLGLITDLQFNAMDKLLDIAVEAVAQRIKKAASGVTSTESGQMDEWLSHTFSIAIMAVDVKKGVGQHETPETHP